MILAEKIYELRTKQNLSQGDLADLLEVSRQSISKWETGTSVPDLDKLIKLSEVFQVTLDELVLDRTTPSRTSNFIPRKAIGISLFWMAFIVLLLGLTSGNYTLMSFSIPFALCSVICLTCKHHAGLWCMWALLLPTDILIRVIYGVSYHYLFVLLFSGMETNLAVIVPTFLFLAAAVLAMITALQLYKKKMQPDLFALALLLGGWALLILCAPLPILLHRYSSKVFSLPYLGGIFVYEAELMLATILLTLTFRYLYNRKKA